MLSLQSHHITDLYVWVDDILPKHTYPLGGRPPLLSDSELITALIWNALVLRQKTLKDLHRWLLMYHERDFPHLPKYKGFVAQCHRLLPVCLTLLQQLLCATQPLRFMDSTMLPVCKRQRADQHRVAKRIAAFGKNHQGWHYGFKLHASFDGRGRICGIALTPANVHDAQVMPKILNAHTRVAVGDTHYGARVMGRKIWEQYGTVIIAPPHPKQQKKLMTPWQHALLNHRAKVEACFDVLKEHFHLVTSFARSVNGYLLHYVRTLLGYQVAMLSL